MNIHRYAVILQAVSCALNKAPDTIDYFEELACQYGAGNGVTIEEIRLCMGESIRDTFMQTTRLTDNK